MFSSYDTNTTHPWTHRNSVPSSLRKSWMQTLTRLPFKPFSLAGTEVGCMMEYLSPTPTAYLYNLVRLDWCSNLSPVSRKYASMATIYGACVLSCGSAFHVGSNTGGLVGMECDRWFDTIICKLLRSEGLSVLGPVRETVLPTQTYHPYPDILLQR